MLPELPHRCSRRAIRRCARAFECVSSARFSKKVSRNRISRARSATATTMRRAQHYESLLARIFRGERALARLNFASGTHAILTALAACTAPGETIVCAAGRPYDTLHYALTSAPNSFHEQGIGYAEVALDARGRFEPGALAEVLGTTPARTIFVQRSRGYSPRPSMSIAEIEELVNVVRSFAPAGANHRRQLLR